MKELGFARRFFGAGEQRTHHHRGSASADGFRKIAGKAYAAIGNDRHVRFLRRIRRFRDGGNLGNANASDHAGGANAAGADANLHRIHAGIKECARSLRRCHIAAHHRHVRIFLLDPANAIQHALGMAVGGIDDDDVHARLHQRRHPIVRLFTGADAGAGAQLPVLVLAGVRVGLGFGDVLDGNHALELELRVHQQHLLDAMPMQQFGDRLR